METDTGALTFFWKRRYVLEMTQTRVSVKETMKQEWLNDLKLTDICVRIWEGTSCFLVKMTVLSLL